MNRGAIPEESSQGLAVELVVAGDHREEHATAVAPRHQGLEDLGRGQTDLARDRLGGQVALIHFVGAQLVDDAQAVEHPGRVGIHADMLPLRPATGRASP